MILPSLALAVSALLSISLALAIGQRDRSTPGRFCFVGMGASTAIWAIAELLELRGLVEERLADRITYVGVLTAGPFWLGFAAHAAGSVLARRVPWFPLLLLLPSAAFYSLMYSPRYGSLFVTTIPGADDRYGPLWYVAASYTRVLVVLGCVAFASTAYRWRRAGQMGRRLVVGLAPSLPLVGNFVYLSIGADWDFDPTPVLIGVSMLALRNGLFRGEVLEALPITQHELIQQLPFGVLTTDSSGAVVQINDLAATRLGVFECDALGHPLNELVGNESDPRLLRSPLRRWGRSDGELVLVT